MALVMAWSAPRFVLVDHGRSLAVMAHPCHEIPGDAGEGGSSPDEAGTVRHCQMGRAR
jgi:hypothetical protein